VVARERSGAKLAKMASFAFGERKFKPSRRGGTLRCAVNHFTKNYIQTKHGGAPGKAGGGKIALDLNLEISGFENELVDVNGIEVLRRYFIHYLNVSRGKNQRCDDECHQKPSPNSHFYSLSRQ